MNKKTLIFKIFCSLALSFFFFRAQNEKEEAERKAKRAVEREEKERAMRKAAEDDLKNLEKERKQVASKNLAKTGNISILTNFH